MLCQTALALALALTLSLSVDPHNWFYTTLTEPLSISYHPLSKPLAVIKHAQTHTHTSSSSQELLFMLQSLAGKVGDTQACKHTLAHSEGGERVQPVASLALCLFRQAC